MTHNSPPLRTLRLTLKKQWFDMIASGEKREEYRAPSKWILSRLQGKTYDVIEFTHGYGRQAPRIIVEYRGHSTGTGKPEWGGTGQEVIIIHLGNILSRHNIP